MDVGEAADRLQCLRAALTGERLHRFALEIDVGALQGGLLQQRRRGAVRRVELAKLFRGLASHLGDGMVTGEGDDERDRARATHLPQLLHRLALDVTVGVTAGGALPQDRERGVEGKRVDLGGGRIIKKKKKKNRASAARRERGKVITRCEKNESKYKRLTQTTTSWLEHLSSLWIVRERRASHEARDVHR